MLVPQTYAADRTILALLVATAAWLSLTLARGPGELAAIWVGNGILTGWLLSRRTATWPAYIAVAFAAELVARTLAGDRSAYSMLIGTCNVLEVLVVAWLVRRRVPDIRDPRQWVGLGGIATAATLLACALSGLGAASVAQVVNDQAFVTAFATWFAAHFVGMVLVATTTLVALRGKRRRMPDGRRAWSLVATLALLVAVAIGVFSIDYPVLFLTYPPLLLAAVRHPVAGVTLGVIALGRIGATATTLGHGPLWLPQDSGGTARIALLQLYLAGGCLMTIPVCLAMAERDRLSARLADTRMQLEHLSRIDSLTGLANRRQFDERFALAVKRLQRQGAPVAVMCFDIDHFKAINDGHGHAAGDVVLKVFAERLGASVRETDLAARLGGDEFVILLEDASIDAARTVATRVVASMADPIDSGAGPVAITASIGAAVAHRPIEAADLMAAADALLYAAKDAGRNRFLVSAVDDPRPPAAWADALHDP